MRERERERLGTRESGRCADRDYRGTRWHARNLGAAWGGLGWRGISGLEALRPIRTNARSSTPGG